MSLCKHIRRPDPQPERGFWLLRCDCGWVGRTPVDARDVEATLDGLFVNHLAASQRRTYLLVDTRVPSTNRSLEQIRADLIEQGEDPGGAENLFLAQPQIIGTFVMPLGLPVRLLGSFEQGGVHRGRFSIDDGPEQVLPIGEVRTADHRVFRVDQ